MRSCNNVLTRWKFIVGTYPSTTDMNHMKSPAATQKDIPHHTNDASSPTMILEQSYSSPR